MLVDSHCHLDQLDLTPFDGDLNGVIQQAQQHDVGYFLNVCIDLDNFPNVLSIAEQYDNIVASVGVHPNVHVEHESSVEELVTLAEPKKIVAIGETGLDTFHASGDLTWQQERFRRHIRASKIVNKPLIVHMRDAGEDTIRILKEEKAQDVGGVLHCFTDTLETAKKAMDLNFYISFSGIVTFKNATDLQQAAKKLPLEHLLVETDSPYLAPVPHRGKSNYPAYVKYVAEKIAELKQLDYEQVALQTTQNFATLFKIND